MGRGAYAHRQPAMESPQVLVAGSDAAVVATARSRGTGMTRRTAYPKPTRQDLIVAALDSAVLVAALQESLRKFRRDDIPEEAAIFARWDALAVVYVAGLRQLREQAIASVWSE